MQPIAEELHAVAPPSCAASTSSAPRGGVATTSTSCAGQAAVRSAVRLVEREHAALVQQRDALAALGFVEVRRRQENRQALLEELRQQLPELAARHRIDAGRRLVEHEQRGSWTSVHASASFCFMPPDSRSASRSRNGSEPGQLEQPRAPRARSRADAVDRGEELDVLVDGQVAVQAEALREVADDRA